MYNAALIASSVAVNKELLPSEQAMMLELNEVCERPKERNMACRLPQPISLEQFFISSLDPVLWCQ